MRRYIAAALLLASSACATTPSQIDAQRLAELRAGETKLPEVTARFGRPDVMLRNLDGSRTAAYLTGNGSRLSMMSAIAGNTSADVDSVIFRFDAGGTLIGYRTTHRAEAARVAPETAGTTPVQANSQSQTDTHAPAPRQASATAASAGTSVKPAAVKPPARAAIPTRSGSENMFLPGNSWTTHTFDATPSDKR